jgi:hypothetical protein
MADATDVKKATKGETWTENVAKDLRLSANYQEHQLGRLETIRKQPKLVGWCLFAIYCCLLVSFENQAAGNVLSIPRFRQDFGHNYDGSYVLYTGWQSAFYGGPLAATIISTMTASAFSDKFGRKYLMIAAILCSFAAIALEFVSVTNQIFFGGKIINGFATGIIWTIGMAYVGEVSPLPWSWRPILLYRLRVVNKKLAAYTSPAPRHPHMPYCIDVDRRRKSEKSECICGVC